MKSTMRSTLFFVTGLAFLLIASAELVSVWADSRPRARFDVVAQKDVTAYELSQCLAAVQLINEGWVEPQAVVDTLPPGVRRHFKLRNAAE